MRLFCKSCSCEGLGLDGRYLTPSFIGGEPNVGHRLRSQALAMASVMGREADVQVASSGEEHAALCHQMAVLRWP